MANDLKLRVLFDMVDGATRPLRNILNGNRGLAKSLKQSRDELHRLQKAQKDIATFREMRAGLVGAHRNTHAAQARVAELARTIASASSPTRAMTAEFEQAKRAAAQLSAAHDLQARKVHELRTRLSSAGVDTHQLGQRQRTLSTQMQAANAAIRQQEERLTRLHRQEQRFNAIRERFNRTRGIAGRSAAVGAGSTAMGAGMLIGAKGLLAHAVEYNASMSRVQALGRLDKHSAEFKALRAQSRELGAATSFTASQAADGQGFLAMAGFRPDQIMKAMPSVLSMATAGNTELARAADISSNIMSGYGLQADQMTRVADVLTATFTTANTDLEMLGETMKYMGPVAKTAGMSLEQASAMAGLLGNAGIQASQAGTTLRSMLLRLASPTGNASKALKELGVASLDAKGNVRDIPTVLRDVALATERMKLGSGQKLGYLKQIFGEEPAAGMAELLAQQGSSGIDKYAEIVKNSRGAARQTARIMADNLQGDLRTAQSAWQDLGITISDTIDPTLRRLTNAITGTIRAVSKWAQDNPALAGTLAKTALALGVVLSTLGVLTLGFAAVLVPMAAVKMSLGVLGIKGVSAIGVIWHLAKAFFGLGHAFLMTPFGMVIGAAVAIGAAAFLIYRHWEPIKGFFSGLWGSVRDAFAGGMGTVGALVCNWSPLGLFYKTFAGVLAWFGVDLPTKFSEFGGNVIAGLVKGITSGLSSVRKAISAIAASTIEWFKERLGIRSPSRVFSEMGGFITQGAALGMEGEKMRIAKAALGLATVATTTFGQPALAAREQFSNAPRPLPLVRPSVPIDRRPPLSAAPAAGSADSTASQIVINIYPPAGVESAQIGRMVRAELERAERAKRSRLGSRLSDSAA